ncbi:MAG: response regulator [Chitinispirillaceae bacterium]
MNELIVVVDDQEFVVEFTRSLLEEAGFTNVETFTDPQLALKRLSGGESAVVISDYKMPGMNGVELLERAMANNPQLFGMVMTAEPASVKDSSLPVFTKDNDSYDHLVDCICDHFSHANSF